VAPRGSRNLRVDIDGDPKGFDLAAKQAQAAAGAFDKELAKLERQERKTEQQTERNAAAMRKLEKAQKEAAGAAQRLERGEIDAAEAARLQERAEKQLNKILMAQAAVSRAAAKAANELAEEQRQAARAAELAAAKQRLAQLKAAGSVKEHNSLVRQLQARFGDLGKEGGKAFTEIGSSASKTSAMLAKSSPLMLAGIVIGLGSLPVLASIAASAVTLGLGGALIGVGVVAAAQSKRVQKAFSDLGKHAKTEAASWGKPFEKSLIQTAGFFENTFDELAPTLRDSLADLAPVLTEFTDDLSRSLVEFKPAIEDVTEAARPLIREVGQQLPGLMNRTADAISHIAAASDPEMFGRFIDGIGMLIVATGDAIYVLSKLSNVVSLVGPISVAASGVDDLTRALRNVNTGADVGAKALDGYQRSVTSFRLGSGLAAAGAGILASQTGSASGAINVMSGTMRLASQTAAQLKVSLDALSGKTLTARAAARDYQQAVDDATASIKENGRTLNINTQAGRNNQAALDNLAVKAHAQAVAFRDSDMSAKQVARGMNEARARFISTSIAMGDTRRHAQQVATQLFGVRNAANSIPKSKSTRITANGVGDAIRASKNMRAAVLSVPSSRTITYYVRNQGAAIRASKAMSRGGYIDGYAGGGEIQGYPAGGMIQGVGGPTADANLIAASRGEFMVNAQSTSEFRPLLEAINAGRVTPKSAAYGSAMSHRPAVSGGGVSRTELVIGSDGSPMGDLLISMLRPAVANKGGNVQIILGGRG
jgi:hypothetical protein